MLKLLLLFLTFIIIPLFASADEAPPELCKQYRQDNSETAPNTKLRESIPYGEGLLWKIEAGNGASAYLFGTMHSQDRKVTSLPPQVRLALVQSQTLVMETVLDQKAQETFTQSMYFQDGTHLEQLLDPEIYNELSLMITNYGINIKDLPRLKPWAAFSLTGRPRPVRAATQDIVLMQLATDANKLVVGLETMQEIVESLDSLPQEDQIIILNDTVCNQTEIIRDTRDLVDLYLARDLAGMVIFNEQPHYDEAIFERFMQHMLYDRNNRMLERIQGYINDKAGAFISVGALHLAGEKGLLNLLEKKGYKISRIY